jgi:peptide chain release factor 1
MLEKLAHIEARYEELTNELSAPELIANPSAYAKAAKQLRTLGEMVGKYRQWKSLKEELTGARELLESADDEEMREMARAEAISLEERMKATESELRLLLIPADPKDEKNVIVEIARAPAAR